MVLKRTVYTPCILPTVTYGSETWNITKKQNRKLRTMQRARERVMLNITWKYKKWMKKQTGVRNIIGDINESKWTWDGHIDSSTTGGPRS